MTPPRLRTPIIGAVAAYELAAITTRRLPTISQLWSERRHTTHRWLLQWITGWVIWHLWAEETQ